MVAVGVHRPGHRVLRDGPDAGRGGAGPPRRHRREDRAAHSGRGRRAAQPGHLQRLLQGLRVRGEEGGRPGEPLLLGSRQTALCPGRGREPRPAEVLDGRVAGADPGPLRRARRPDGRLAGRRRARPAGKGAGRRGAGQGIRRLGSGVIDEARKKQMAAPGLQEPAKKALATLDREWDGLIAHRNYPMISLDNNAAERAVRLPVVTRRNAGGSRNGDTAGNAAIIWTVTATARMAGLNVLAWLTAYLDECGRNGGKPLAGPALERFLPWNASPEDLRTWAQPPPAGPNPRE